MIGTTRTDDRFVATWFRIGCLSFGGPAGQIAMMHDMAVIRKKWMDEASFLSALNFCMLLPGPEAQQLATFIGWKTRGIAGGLIAGGLFVLPGALVVLLLAMAYVSFADLTIAGGLLLGVKAAVIAIIVQAMWRLAQKVLYSVTRLALAVAAFLAIAVFSIPYPVVIATAALVGVLAFSTQADTARAPADTARPMTLGAVVLTAASWAGLVGLALTVSGEGDAFGDIATFFSTLAVVTFGGAYAVLAYMTDQAVTVQGWLTAPEMVDALGLAETTPGPLILVTQFVGFLAAYRFPGPLDPMVAGVIGAVLTTLVTFIPSFLWIFLGAPHLDRLITMPRLQGALAGVTAAVLGVIAALAVWFAGQVLFSGQVEIATPFGGLLLPDPTSLDVMAAFLVAVAVGLLFRLKWNVPLVVGAMALLGFGTAIPTLL